MGYGTATVGNKSGTATIALTSDGTGTSGLANTLLTSQTVSVTGSVFRLASGGAAPAGPVNFGIVHVGDTASQTLTVTNTAANDGFSEKLNAAVTAQSGAATGTGTANQILPGSNSTALSLNMNTGTAGVKSGSITLGLTSDGTGTSGLGTSPLTSQTINISGQVNNFASAHFLLNSGPGTLTGGGISYSLNFGTMNLNAPFRTLTLGLENNAAAPADSLAGSFVLTAGNYLMSNFTAFSGVLAGGSIGSLDVGFNPDQLGTFNGTITLNPRSQNAGGFDGAQTPVIVGVTGSVVVPEPHVASLLALGGMLAGLRRRRVIRVARVSA